MKKILSWILIVAMLLASVMTMTACDLFGKEVKEEALSQDEVDDLLNAVSAKMEDLDDLEIRCSLDMKMVGEGVTVEIPLILNVKLDDYNSETPAFELSLSGSYMGTSLNMAMYYVDGWSYVYSGTDGYKQETDNPFAEMDMGMMEIPTLDEEAMAMLEELIAELSDRVEAVTEDGVTEIKLKITVRELMEMAMELSEYMSGEALDGEDLEEMTEMLNAVSGDLELTMTVANEYITKIALDANVSTTVDGVAASYEVAFELEIVDPGQSVTVTLPDGAEELPDINGGNGGSDYLAAPYDADTAVELMEGFGYDVTVQTDSNYTVVTCIKGEDALILYYFNDGDLAYSCYESLQAEIDSDAGVIVDYYDTIVWVGTFDAVFDMSKW